jgi:D-glycero-alpha-D-manno-heptose-7-phosphate kinase
MIISRTPFRISFLGGGTDLPSYYEQAGEEGAVLSTTINKYMYITVNDRFDDSYRLSYSKTEIVKSVDEIEHKILKVVLKRYAELARSKNGKRGLEILSMADIPGGTGLGSSSSFTVSLLHAMKAHCGIFQSASDLAREASEIEIDILHEPIGKQDQYAAAFGGLQFIRFLKDGQVSVDPVICSSQTKKNLQASMLLLYTGKTRSASDVLAEQKSRSVEKRETLRELASLAHQMKNRLEQGTSISKIGELLNEGWLLKKSLASGIADSQIDQWYETALKAGAWGGKLLGAGGGGFLLLLCDPAQKTRIASELKELRPIDIEFDSFGSKIIFVSEES